MKRRSFSEYGMMLEKRFSKDQLDKKQLLKMLHKTYDYKLKKPINLEKSKSIINFAKQLSRDNITPFQSCYNKKSNLNSVYQCKVSKLSILKNQTIFSFRKEKQQRLSFMMPKIMKSSSQPSIKQRQDTENSSSSIFKSNQSMHHLDFNKQIPRTIQSKLNTKSSHQQKTVNPQVPSRIQQIIEKRKQDRLYSETMKNVHSFNSYTPRKFFTKKLYSRDIAVIEPQKVPLQKYKWKTTHPLKFDKMVFNKLPNQKVTDNWYAKLDYDYSQKKKIKGFSMQKQTKRLSHDKLSKYPIRIAL